MTALRQNKFTYIVCALLAAWIVFSVWSDDLEPIVDKHWAPSAAKSISFQREIRTAAILTTSYVDTNTLDVKEFKNLCLLFSLTQGSLTSFEYIVYVSDDNVTYYQEATETIAAALITDTVANYTIALSGDLDYYKLVPVYSRYIKLAVKGTGTATGSSCTVTVTGRY